MAVLFKSFIQVDYSNSTCNPRDIPEGFNQHIESLIAEMYANTTVRKYKPEAQTTQVVTCARELLAQVLCEDEPADDEIGRLFNDVAQKLLRIEIQTQAQIQRMGQNVKKGSLIQALFSGQSDEYLYPKLNILVFLMKQIYYLNLAFQVSNKKYGTHAFLSFL